MRVVNDQALAHIGYRRVEPGVELREFIDCYWFIEASCRHAAGYNQFLHPDGGLGLFFNYGDTLAFNGQQKDAGAYLDGTNTRSISLGLNGNISAVGIRFKPAGASVFFNLPLTEFKDQQLDLTDVNMQYFSQLYEVLPTQSKLSEKVTTIEQILMQSRLRDKYIAPQMHNAIGALKRSQGRVAVTELARHIDIGQRKLERLFQTQLGMRPGELARALRVRAARSQLKQTDIELAEIAYRLGFYDQAHFSKSFKTVVGLTPGAYRLRAQAGTSGEN